MKLLPRMMSVAVTSIMTATLGIALAGGAMASPLATSAATSSASAQVSSEGFEAAVTEAQKYILTKADGSRVFDTKRAKSGKASADVLALGEQFNRVAQSYGKSGSGGVTTQGISLPVWGNWCGPGHGGGTPKDTLDTICMRHDKCYGARGYFDCLCDKQLRDEITRYKSRMGGTERTVAAAVYIYFSNSPCVPH